jgi:multiple sugar transport system substrate-binding protein
MEEIEFSSMVGSYNPDEYPNISEFRGISEFEVKSRIKVRQKRLLWMNAWQELLQVALYFKGPDVSEIGTTWLGSLMGMEALRPFSPLEVKSLGGAAAFSSASWDSCHEPGEIQILAIPWYLDLRLIYYRRDILQKAGVDESTAFLTSGNLLDTMQKLRASGFTTPLAMDILGESPRVVHNIASWIWESGGDFRSQDGHQLKIKDPKTLEAIVIYYKLGQFLMPGTFGLEEIYTNQAFAEGQVAVAISSERLYLSLRAGRTQVKPEILANLGIAPLLSMPFLGGANLVIWRHTVHDRAAIDLVNFLTSPLNLKALYEQYMVIPARTEVLKSLPLAEDPYFSVFQRAIMTGRVIPGFYRWAGVENRLTVTFHQLWSDLLANQDINPEDEVPRRVIDMANRLERTTLANW